MIRSVCFILLIACIVFAQSCKGGHANFTETNDTVRFYPIIEYFKGQIKSVDSSAGLIYKITINSNGAKDSSALSKQQFNLLAQIFTNYDISDKSIHKYYKENIFNDETTQSITFNYTAIDSTLPLQTVDILLDQEDQHVTRVFLNIVKSGGDSTVTEKAGWKTGNSFFINRITDHPDNTTTTQQNIIVWQNEP